MCTRDALRRAPNSHARAAPGHRRAQHFRVGRECDEVASGSRKNRPAQLLESNLGKGVGAMRVIRHLFDELDRVNWRLNQADRLLIALDYDGTLAPITATPQEAVITPETAAVLGELASCPAYSVAVVSGRSIADLRPRLTSEIIYVGNHGLEIEGAGFSFVHEGAEATRSAIESACWDLEEALQSVRGVLIERKGLSATVHYRQAPPDLYEWIAATVNATL